MKMKVTRKRGVISLLPLCKRGPSDSRRAVFTGGIEAKYPPYMSTCQPDKKCAELRRRLIHPGCKKCHRMWPGGRWGRLQISAWWSRFLTKAQTKTRTCWRHGRGEGKHATFLRSGGMGASLSHSAIGWRDEAREWEEGSVINLIERKYCLVCHISKVTKCNYSYLLGG